MICTNISIPFLLYSKRLSPILHQGLSGVQGLNVDWQRTPTASNSHIVKKMLRLDIPHDSHPNVRYVNHYFAVLEIARSYSFHLSVRVEEKR
jgi:hypothetical protein